MLLAVPVVINNFVRSAYNLIDALYVSSIGSTEIAAITFVSPINTLVLALGDGLAIAGTTLIARKIGKAEYNEGKDICTQLFVISIILGVIIACTGFIFSKQLLVFLAATPSLIITANIYFKITVLSAPFSFMNASFLAIKRAQGDTLKAMNVNFVSMLFKAFITYIMIFHMNMGVESLALSTIFSNILVSIYGYYDLFIRDNIMKLSYKGFEMNWEIIFALFIVGLPIVLEKSSVSTGFIMINKQVLSYGEEVLAGYGITNRINSLVFASVTGFGTALATIISQNLGADQSKRAVEAVKKTGYIALNTSIVVISFLLYFKVPIARIFSKGDDLILYHTVNAISVYSISLIPWGIFQVVIGVFQGSGYTKYNLIISLTRLYAFRLPLVIVLSKYFNIGEYSIWYAMLWSNILTALFSMILYCRINWTKLNLRLEGE